MIDYGLSNQQIEVISALSSGASMTAAAEQAGVHRNTIAYWRRNLLPFQYGLAHAQYDRALLFREKTGELVDLAVKTIRDILADPHAPAGVRLKAALAVIQTASTPPEPEKQISIDIEKVKYVDKPEPQILSDDELRRFAHKDAQNAPSKTGPVAAPPASTPENLHKKPQTFRRESPKVGRNEPCPCGSGLKYKRCCIHKPQANAQAAA